MMAKKCYFYCIILCVNFLNNKMNSLTHGALPVIKVLSWLPTYSSSLIIINKELYKNEIIQVNLIEKSNKFLTGP